MDTFHIVNRHHEKDASFLVIIPGSPNILEKNLIEAPSRENWQFWYKEQSYFKKLAIKPNRVDLLQ